MSKVLLVGLDCSECSERALEYAASGAAKSNLQLIVVHVIDWSPFTFSTEEENEERRQRRESEMDRAHREIVDPVVSRLREQGIYARGVIRHGHPAETICSVAREFGATNLIMGKTGSSKVETQLIGSVANTLTQISRVPVTVVP